MAQAPVTSTAWMCNVSSPNTKGSTTGKLRKLGRGDWERRDHTENHICLTGEQHPKCQMTQESEHKEPCGRARSTHTREHLSPAVSILHTPSAEAACCWPDCTSIVPNLLLSKAPEEALSSWSWRQWHQSLPDATRPFLIAKYMVSG